MSTPYLDEAERCNRVAMMNNGKIIAMDSPQKIKESMTKSIVEIICSPIREAYKIINDKTDFGVQMFGDRIDVVLNDYEKDYPGIENLLRDASIPITDNRLISPSLENVFIHLIKKN